MAGTHQDITKRKIAEEQLKKFSVAIEQSPASIVITNKFAEIEYVNPYFCMITGYSLDEVLGKNPRILKSGDKSKEEYQKLWANIRSGKPWNGEFKNKKKNGEIFWESASISPIRDANGEINNFIAVKEEITYKKKIEELLLASEQKYRSIFELSPFGMAAVKPNGKIELVNKKLEELIGYSIDEIKDIQSWMELVFPDESYRNQVKAQREHDFSQISTLGFRSEPMEIEVRTKLGENKTFELTHVQIGEFQISVFNDISERNLHLKAIEKQNGILREISWIQSHVVRAPLARMMGLLEFVENKEYDLIPEADLLGLLRVSMDELDGHINEISKKAYLVNYLANEKNPK
ncbi:MAG: PAS domain S-box protein, partial [Bacteroidia bacterium]|nr:PAS domain S-box protein [Bacteroidia bacterium]